MVKKIEYDADLLFDSLISEGISSFEGGGNISVVEFAEDILFNGEYELYPTQRALLKTYYGEPLEEDEKAILQEWCVEDRTTWIEDRSYANLVLEAGRRGSKSSICSIISLYELYKLISLPSPAQHYGLLPNSPIAIFVISQSLDQVKETLFAAIKGYAEGSAYFKGLVKSGKIEILSTEIRCAEKNVGIYAKHTNSKSLVGYSIKCLILDEAARFEIDEFGHSKADEIWQNVGRAVRTFGKEGRKVAISSAWEPGDYIEILYDVASKDSSTIGFRLRTWDLNLNPNLSETAIKASEDYIKDPLLAALEYEGIRTSKQGSFFVPDHVRNSFTGTSVLDAREIKLDIKNKEGDLRHYVGVEIDRLVAVNSGHSFAHCDYGVKKDSAAFAVVRPFQREDGKWVIQVDGLLRWKPFLDRDKNNKGIRRVVSFLNAEDKIIQVCKARRVMLMSFDSFQCLEVGSLVSTPYGLTPVENLKQGDVVYSENGVNEIRYLSPKSEVPLIKIKTKFGYELSGTPNHPIRNKKGDWVNLEDLKIGDVIKLNAPSEKIEEFNRFKSLSNSESLALLTGYLVAEGNWGYCTSSIKGRVKKDGTQKVYPRIQQYLGFTNGEEETIEDYVSCFKEVFNTDPCIYKKENHYSVRSNKTSVLTQWNSLDVKDGAWNKEIPNFIFQGSHREIGLFLSGLFEGDGCCQPRDNKGGGSLVTLVTVSKKLADQVQILLLNFGIKSSKKFRHYPQKNGLADINRYCIYIYGHNLINFQRYIGFRSARKSSLLIEAIQGLSFERKSRATYLEDKVVSIENLTGDIIQMEVSGDHSYKAQGFINHNSEHTIQKLHTQGITTKEMKTSTQMQLTYFSVTKTLMSQGLLILPKDSMWSTALEAELLGIFQIPSTGKIDHSKAGKDMCDALTNSVYNCYLHMAKSGLMSAMAGGIATIGSEAKKKLDKYNGNQEIQKREAVKKLQTLKLRGL